MLSSAQTRMFSEAEIVRQKVGESPSFVACKNCGQPVTLRTNCRPRVHAFCEADGCRRAAKSARDKASRSGQRLRPIDPPMPDHVRSLYGDNSALISAVARLYIPDDAIVVDVTWGLGVFWRRFNGHRRFTLVGSDIRDVPGRVVGADFRRLPYADASVDVIVLDPPYVHGGHYINGHAYGAELTNGMRHREVMGLYRDGMVEARRVLRRGGTLWVKCKDENDGKQNWSHITIFNMAAEIELSARDLFVLAPRPKPTRLHQRQKHAHKSHSYLWVFAKPRRARAS